MKKYFKICLLMTTCFIVSSCDLSFDKDGGEVVTNLTALPTPINVRVGMDNYIYWDEVPNASSYIVKINDYQESAGNQLKYSISSIMNSKIEYNVPTELHIYIKAKGNQISYSDSNWSNEVVYSYTKTTSGESVNHDEESLKKAKELRIGYAYNFIKDVYFDVTNSSTNSVLDLEQLLSTASLNEQSSSYTKSGKIYEETIDKFHLGVSAAISSEISTKGELDIFSANISAGLKSSSSIEFDKYGKSGFLNCYSYSEYKNYQIIDYGTSLELSAMLTKNFLELLKKEGIYSNLSNDQVSDYILNNYGTHLVMGVKTGGRLDYYYTFATNNSSAAADFKKEIYANGSGGVAGLISASTNNSLSMKLATSISNDQTKNASTFEIYGGSTDGIFETNIDKTFISWSNSINESNARSIGISKNGVIYLPTLISYVDKNIANMLDTKIKETADKQYKELLARFKTNDDYIDQGDTTKLDDLVVYNDTIRTGEYKVAGSGRKCSASFTLYQNINDLISMGYDKIRINIDYQLREQDDCWIYVNLYDENNNSLYYRKVEHGKGVDYNYASYTIDEEFELKSLPSNKLKIEFKAENKIFKDFYVGTVTGKVVAFESIDD